MPRRPSGMLASFSGTTGCAIAVALCALCGAAAGYVLGSGALARQGAAGAGSLAFSAVSAQMSARIRQEDLVAEQAALVEMVRRLRPETVAREDWDRQLRARLEAARTEMAERPARRHQLAYVEAATALAACLQERSRSECAEPAAKVRQLSADASTFLGSSEDGMSSRLLAAWGRI